MYIYIYIIRNYNNFPMPDITPRTTLTPIWVISALICDITLAMSGWYILSTQYHHCRHVHVQPHQASTSQPHQMKHTTSIPTMRNNITTHNPQSYNIKTLQFRNLAYHHWAYQPSKCWISLLGNTTNKWQPNLLAATTLYITITPSQHQATYHHRQTTQQFATHPSKNITPWPRCLSLLQITVGQTMRP